MNVFVWSLASFCAVSTDENRFGSFVAGSICGRVMKTFDGNMEIEPFDSYKGNVIFAVSALVSCGCREMMICSFCDLKSAIYGGKAKAILIRSKNWSDADSNVGLYDLLDHLPPICSAYGGDDDDDRVVPPDTCVYDFFAPCP